jgi:hypothetical protein
MSDETLRVEIEGDEIATDRGGGRTGSIRGGGADDAEADLRAARRERAAALNDLQRAHQQNAARGLETVESRSQTVQRDIRMAMETGEYDKAAGLQAQLAEIAVEKRDLQRWKSQIESTPADPLAAMERTAPRSADWLREHPEFLADATKNAKMRAAHFDAVAHDITPESDAYFKHVEKYVGVRGGRGNGGGRSNGGAAPSVGIGDRIPANASTIRMSREAYDRAKELAAALDLDVGEYLRRKQVMDNDPQWRRMNDLDR